jgi:hypothetical protein
VIARRSVPRDRAAEHRCAECGPLLAFDAGLRKVIFTDHAPEWRTSVAERACSRAPCIGLPLKGE